MKNAHARFGRLEFTRLMRDTTTEVQLPMDRFIGEAGEKGTAARAHLASVVGGDQDVGAVWAGVVENDFFTVSGPDVEPITVAFGEGAQCFRGTLNVCRRKRPVRHLVVVSAEMAGKMPEDGKVIRTILCDSDAGFVLYRVAERMGLPVVPEWAGWFREELERRKAVAPLIGVGCTPLAVTASKKALLKWIGRAVRRGEIRFPEQNGPISWSVANNFLRPANEESGEALTQDVETLTTAHRASSSKIPLGGRSMKMVMNVSSRNENDDGGCVLACIDLTPQLAELALRRVETLAELQARDQDADKISYWNYDAVFFDPFLGPGGGLEGASTAANEQLLDRLEKAANDFVEVDGTFHAPAGQIAAIECGQMIGKSARPVRRGERESSRPSGIAFSPTLPAVDVLPRKAAELNTNSALPADKDGSAHLISRSADW